MTPRPPRLPRATSTARSAALSVVICLAVTVSTADAASITSISVPVDSHDATSHALTDGVWSVSAPPYPLDIATGIGYVINPVVPLGSADFALHDHVYLSPNIPDPSRAVITFGFDAPTVVDQIEIIQHTNGISQIEGFVGNSIGSLTSVGSVFGPLGDVTGFKAFTEGESQAFDFNNLTAGTIFQVVIRKTPFADGWSTYRMFPTSASGDRFLPATTPIPEPGTAALLALGLLGLATRRLRTDGV